MYDCDVDFSGCIEPPKDIGKYKKFMIRISGLYFSGDGFRTKQDIDVWEAIKSELKDMIPDFTGYFGKLVYVSNDGNGHCDTVIAAEPEYEPSNIYLHPESLSGILLDEHIDLLYDWLNNYFKRINRQDCSTTITYKEDTYHMTDTDYASFLYTNSDKIIERVQQYLNKLTPKKKESYLKFGYNNVGFDFAKTGRIERDFSNHMGYTSSDTDIVIVKTIIKNAIDKGILK